MSFWVVWWAGAHHRSHRSWLLVIPRTQRYLTFISGFPRAFWCSRGKHVRIPYASSRDQIHHRLRFCCGFFFTWFFLRSFRHHFKTIGGTEMADVEQIQKMIPFITCEISLCQYVCELVLGVNQCIWFGSWRSKLILSNNQSRATLWVPETCLIVRILSFMIILITASLSSKIYNKASLREECTFKEIKSTLSRSSIFPWIFFRVGDLCGSYRSWFVWDVFPWRTATIRSRKSSAGIPSDLNPASKEMISDSVELCETEVCFLYIQLIGTNVWLLKMHNVPPDVDFESSRSPAKSESWNSPNLHCLAVFPTWQYCLYSLVWWM